jgi:hypothetical protein
MEKTKDCLGLFFLELSTRFYTQEEEEDYDEESEQNKNKDVVVLFHLFLL